MSDQQTQHLSSPVSDSSQHFGSPFVRWVLMIFCVPFANNSRGWSFLTIMTFDEHTGHFIPLVYMLLNTKKEENYWFAFWDLSHLLPPDQITWQSITTDFEKALINAVARTWANVPIQGCLFHFKEALLRKAQKKSLTNNDQLPKVLKTIEEIAGFSFEENGSEKLQGFSRKCTYARKFRAND